MNQPEENQETPLTLWACVVRAWRRSRFARPVSFYLLFAILFALLLGVRIVYVQDDPVRFASFLTLFFILFFFVLVRAIIDLFDILRRHFTERERVFRSTLGETEFAEELGRRVAERREE